MKSKQKIKKSGISLIVLVITIIVIIILAVAVILSMANNNPIENANKAKFQNDLKTMQEELELIKQKNYADNNGQSYQNEDNSDISISDLSTAKGKYENKFRIKNGTLEYFTNVLTVQEKEWISGTGIEGAGDLLENGANGVEIKDGKLSGKYNSNSETKNLIISDDVSIIDKDVFRECNKLESVELPDTVTTIGNMCFYKCVSLKSIKIPSKVTTIGDNAFNGCSTLETVVLQNRLEKIGSGAFSACAALKELVIPSTVTTIGVNAFWGCDANLTIYVQTEEIKTLVQNSGFKGTVKIDSSKF